MIYKIESKFITEMSSDMHMLLLSADGNFVLIQSDSTPNFEYLQSINKSELTSISKQAEWKQPCINCQ